LAVSLAGIAIAGAGLMACPLPQPLPELTLTDGGARPPQILVDTAIPNEPLVKVAPFPACEGYRIDAVVHHLDWNEDIQARWFLDYQTTDPGVEAEHPLFATGEENRFLRPVPTYTFNPQACQNTNVHVVELVVTQRFAPEPTAVPNRTAMPGYETQVFRWVFECDPTGGCRE
jgi:hypothetical protein